MDPRVNDPHRFPPVFWIANVTELFERAAYYAMASFVVIYLAQLGLGKYWPSTLNGLLWTLVYFLPILSGTIADQIGFRRALLAAMVLLVLGHAFMGTPVWLFGAELRPPTDTGVTAGMNVVLPVVLGMILIGTGGSVVKPCILGTAQKSAGARATLAFSIFYMVVNIGSLVGRGISYVVRTHSSLSGIFAVAASCGVVALVVVAVAFREPAQPEGTPAKPRKTVGEILVSMVVVLKNVRFTLFLLVMSGFWFLYTQVYNVLPLYMKKVVETDPPVDVYTMANPAVIVCFQLVVTRLFGKIRPVRSIILGSVIIGFAMVINLVPLYAETGLRGSCCGVPMGSLFIVITVALIAFGELFTSARSFEFIGALAPKGQEGLFLGYANLPTAIGSLVGGPVGAAIFNEVMCKGATTRADGLLELVPAAAARGWLVLMAIGFASALSMWLFNRWLERQEPAAA